MKILFALNHKGTEDLIAKNLCIAPEDVQAVTYREAILASLAETPVDVLVLRDSLKGALKNIKLLEEIRTEYSETQIIYICSEKKRGDKEMAQIVGLGIYDIISKDSVPAAEIVTCIKNKKQFRDVAMFYLSDYIPEIEATPEALVAQPAKKGFMAGLLGTKPTTTTQEDHAIEMPQMNVDVLRKALKEEAIREAQQDMDGLIKKAVALEMSTANQEIERLQEETALVQGKMGQKESRIAQLNKQLTDEKNKFEELKIKMETHVEETKKGFALYEEQISTLHSATNTPTWYAEQSEKFATREKELIAEITRLRPIVASQETEKKQMIEEIASLKNASSGSNLESEVKIQMLESQLLEARSQSGKPDTESLLRIQVLEEQLRSSSSPNPELEMKVKVLEEQLARANQPDLETQIKIEVLQKQLAEAQAKAFDNRGNQEMKTQMITIQRELEVAQQKLEEVTESEPVVKYIEKEVVKEVVRDDPNMALAMQSIQRENTSLNLKVRSLEDNIRIMEESPSSVAVGELDYSTHATHIPMIPDRGTYVASNNPVKLVVMMGAKHGIGNTTVALNIATHLAKQSKKTLLIEFNHKFPMTNQFFELNNLPLGISDALSSVSHNPSIADASIVRFHALSSANKQITKTYKRLPAGLHLLTFANKDLGGRKPDLIRDELFALLQYLLSVQHYAHIILDIQPDDQGLLETLVDSRVEIDKLIFTTSQDPHGVASIGKLASVLSNGETSSLFRDADLIVNKQSNGYLSSSKIAKHLHFDPTQVFSLSDDTEGYVNASSAALPYVLTKGHYKEEYAFVCSKIF